MVRDSSPLQCKTLNGNGPKKMFLDAISRKTGLEKKEEKRGT